MYLHISCRLRQLQALQEAAASQMQGTSTDSPMEWPTLLPHHAALAPCASPCRTCIAKNCDGAVADSSVGMSLQSLAIHCVSLLMLSKLIPRNLACTLCCCLLLVVSSPDWFNRH
jgi:hypothetical protein